MGDSGYKQVNKINSTNNSGHFEGSKKDSVIEDNRGDFLSWGWGVQAPLRKCDGHFFGGGWAVFQTFISHQKYFIFFGNLFLSIFY